MVKSLDPSCDAGASSNDAVSATACCRSCTGPGTTCAGTAVASRCPFAVQSAPVSVQARSAGTRIDTAPLPAGCTVNSQRSFRPSTRLAPVTVPPLTRSAWSRIAAGSIVTSSLNDSRKVNGFDPSCDAGRFSKDAVSGARDRCFPKAPGASRICNWTVSPAFHSRFVFHHPRT